MTRPLLALLFACTLVSGCGDDGGGTSGTFSDRIETAGETVISIVCDCWESAEFSSKEQCETELTGTPDQTINNCIDTAFGIDDTGSAYVDCVVNYQNEYVDCIVQAACDPGAEAACDSARGEDSAECFESMSADVRSAYNECTT